MTTFVDMYHPALGNVHVMADSSAVSLYEAHGWVLTVGTGPTPDPIGLTVPLGDLRYAKLADIGVAGTPTGDAGRAAFDARYGPVLAAFPPAPAPSSQAQVSSWAVADNAANCPHPPGTGTQIVFATQPEPGRYDWMGNAGQPFTYVWNGNNVLRPGIAKGDIGISQTAFRCRTNSSWLMLQSQLSPAGTFDGLIQVRVNGVNLWPLPKVFTGTYGGAFGGIDLTFADTSWKTVEIFQVGWLYSINYESTATMTAWKPTGQKKLLIVGDSWTAGTSQSSPQRSYAAALQLRSGWDVSYQGAGGTGYVAGGVDPWDEPYGGADRLVAVTDYQPDVLAVVGAINDNGLSGIQAAAGSYYSAVASASPATKIVVAGPQLGDAQNPATDAALRAATAAAGNVIGYVAPYSAGWDVAGVRGPSDFTHPSAIGAEWYARMVEAAIRSFTSAAGDSSW